MDILALMDYLGESYHALGTLVAAHQGDPMAQVATRDILEEEGLMKNPYKVGQSYLICTVTLYYIGRVKEVGFGYLILEDASWVHWTGRLSLLLKHQSFTHRELGSRKPRTEYVGEVIIDTHARVSGYPWHGNLPKEAVE